MNKMIVIYTPVITSRIRYVMKVIIEDLLQKDFSLTDVLSDFEKYEGVKFAYANGQDILGLRFGSSGLLQQVDIRPQALDAVAWEGFSLFFPVADSELPFDPFSLSFYLITRYEEYLPSVRDAHGRFDIKNSIAYRNGFYRKPLVNIIANEIGRIIHRRFPDFSWEKRSCSFLLTYDVDIAYQYRGKTFFRFCASLLKSILKGDYEKASCLIRTVQGKPVYDKFDTFELHRLANENSPLKPIHFILTSPFGKYDRNINPKGPVFHALIRKISEFSEIGLHPSYHASQRPALILKQKRELEKISGHTITKSRQHFLRFDFPDTFNHLVHCGITDDYSLGWTDNVGFRASIATPFPFYDLREDKEKPLVFHPLAVMDSALDRVAETHLQKREILRLLKEEVVQNGGELILLFHNSYTTDERQGDLQEGLTGD